MERGALDGMPNKAMEPTGVSLRACGERSRTGGSSPSRSAATNLAEQTW